MGFSQYRVWASIAGVILTICITLCPHAVHSAVGEDIRDVSGVEAAIAAESAHHDHEHCELDAAHSHEFLLPSSSPVDTLFPCTGSSACLGSPWFLDRHMRTPLNENFPTAKQAHQFGFRGW
jgi:hypothetical protein